MKPPPCKSLGIPSLKHAADLLERSGADDGLWGHSVAVATVSVRIAAGLVDSGAILHMDAVAAGGLLHDIGKGFPGHAQAGARIVAEEGFPAIAEIIALHSDFVPTENAPISEAEVVFLADKLVRRSRCVSLESRFAEAATRFAGDPEAQAGVSRRRLQALRCRDRMASVLRTTPEQLASAPSGHPLEQQLAEIIGRLGKSPGDSDACWPTHPSTAKL